MAEIPANSAFTVEEMQKLNQAVPGRFLVPGREDLGEVGYGEYLAWITPTRDEKLGVAGLSAADPAMPASAVSAAIAAGSSSIRYLDPNGTDDYPAPDKFRSLDNTLAEENDALDVLVLDRGTTQFVDGPVDGKKWMRLDGSTMYTYAGASIGDYRVNGAFSAVCMFQADSASDEYFWSMGGVTDDNLYNSNHSFGIKSSPFVVRTFHEGPNTYTDATRTLATGTLRTAGFTRAANGTDHKFLMDGYSAGNATSAAAPSDGTSSTFYLGGFHGGSSMFKGYLASVAFWFAELTEAQMLAALRYMKPVS